MEQLHFVLRSKHCRKVVSREQLVVLPSPAGTPGMATGKESHAAMGTHIGNNPGQPSSFWLWVCARVCRGLCCAAGSPSSQPCPAPLHHSLPPPWPLSGFLCVLCLPLSASIVPFIQPSVQGPFHPLSSCALTPSFGPPPDVPLCHLISCQYHCGR